MLKKFPNQIEMYADESFEGFLHRLADMNHRKINELGFRNTIYRSDLDYNLERLYQLTGITVLQEKVFTSYWHREKLTLPEWKKRLYTRYCPYCLKDHLYHRTFWCLTHHAYCPRHKVFLIERCLNCNVKLTISDVIRGNCSNCFTLLKECGARTIDQVKLYLQEDGEFIGIDSPYLRLSLSIKNQIILVRLLAYFLVDYYLFDIEIETEQMKLLYKGYFENVQKQFELTSKALELLVAWPTSFILFLRKYFEKKKGDVDWYYHEFIDSITRNFQIRIALLDYKRLDSGNYCVRNFNEEQIHFDRYYLSVTNLLQHFKISCEKLYKILKKLNINLLVHPRNKLKIVHIEHLKQINDTLLESNINDED
jgi:hypothetical protein